MNKNILAGIFLSITTFAYAQDDATKYAESITPEDLKKHLVIIAADSMKGRDTGSPGQKMAAEYVLKYFKEYGLQPIAAAADGSKSFLQKYNLYKRGWGEVYVKAGGKQYEFNKDFYLNGILDAPAETNTPVVLAGYGIEEPAYNDYANLNVTGKSVIIFEGEPKLKDGNYLLSGNGDKSKWNSTVSWQNKVKLALEKGAKHVFIISEKTGEDFDKEIRQRAVMARRFSSPTLKPVKESSNNIASFVLSAEMAAQILNTSVQKLTKEKDEIGKTKKPLSKSLSGEATFKAERTNEIIETENVAAYMEGSDKKDEVLVISAHLDHIGISPNGEINNGADDDGSGTVSLLELAEAFSKAKADGKGPRRSILFLNVTGEEKGLFGSEYYSENPLLPLKNTVADLNIDMIGRVDEAHKNDPKYVYVIGADKLSSQLHAISEEANKKYVNYKLDYTFNDPKDPNRFYYRSDHYNFAKVGIPVIFYFTGVHEDYHRPGDDVEKIMFDKQAPIVKLVFHTAWELANREERIVVDSHKE
ncbi:M28 family peptidase [Dyadobacter sp. NIV53]|uniref:M28 family peptidase n=1 Tax=Dyadobacter sp. NIV53 TaxID=2861765 RepID=UPI001C86E094|nr:M28 family peptidase [Dyadobacter sp. NIV53]